jgi:hypothetical protein
MGENVLDVPLDTRLLTIPAFAKATGLSCWSARELVRSGEVPSVPVGRRRRVSARFINEWIERSVTQCPATKEARAVFAERERCARIAEQLGETSGCHYDNAECWMEAVAAKIRSGE